MKSEFLSRIGMLIQARLPRNENRTKIDWRIRRRLAYKIFASQNLRLEIFC